MLDFIGYLLLGLVAGAVSGWFIGIRSIDGCLPTIIVGVLGAAVGGWLSRELGAAQPQSFMGAVIFAVVGAIIVRLVLRVIEGRR